MSTAEKVNAKLITPEFRGSFVQILKPKAFSSDQEPKYSMVIVIPKEDDFVDKLNKMIEAVAIEKFGEMPNKLKTFIKDGDQEDEKYDWGGNIVFTASNKSKPGLMIAGMSKDELAMFEPTDEEIYSGAVYRASIRPYAYEYNKSKGVAISLDNVLKVRDGEKFTSRTTAQDDFAEFAEGDWD